MKEVKRTSENQAEHATTAKSNADSKKEIAVKEKFWTWARKSSLTDRIIALFTAILAGAAIYQFSITDSQLDVMRKQQRAWLSIKATRPTYKIGDAPTTSIAIENIGNTPATNIALNFYIEVVAEGSQPRFDEKIMHTSGISGVIAPKDRIDLVTSRHKVTSSDPDPLIESEKTALDDGKAWIAIHGGAAYDDVFKVRHKVNFCAWIAYRSDVTIHAAECIEIQSA